MFASTGTSAPTRCQSRLDSSTPAWRAMALMWMGTLVEAAMADATAIAFSNAGKVMILRGVASSRTRATARRPVS